MLYVYIIISLFFIFLSVKITKKILNPVTIFCGIWLLIILSYQFQLSNWQGDLITNSYITFIINIFAFSICYLLVYKVDLKKCRNEKKQEEKIVSYNVIKKIFIFWVIIECIETIFSGGLPLIWKLTGSSKTYASYGIPTLHGLMNSISLVIIILSYYLYLYDKHNMNKKNNKLLIIIGIILLFDLLIITRQVIVSALIEIFVIHFCFNKKISILKTMMLIVIFIIMFGLIGNLRTGYDNFLYVSSFKNANVNNLLIGFYWVYMYFNMSIANINNAVFLGINHYGMYPIMKNYLPTMFSNVLFSDSSIIIPDFLVTKAFNVSGYFINFYLAFGNLGVFMISAIYGILGGIFNKKYIRDGSEKNLLYIAVYIQIIVLSFFENHLLYLPSGFQIVLIFLIFNVFYRRKNHA